MRLSDVTTSDLLHEVRERVLRDPNREDVIFVALVDLLQTHLPYNVLYGNRVEEEEAVQ